MGGALCRSAAKVVEEAPAEVVAALVDENLVEIYASSPEEEAEIRARMARYEKERQKKLAAKAMSAKRRREAIADEAAIALLKTQLSDLLCMKQLTTEYQICRYGKEHYAKNRAYLPNRLYDWDRIEIKALDMSRGNDLKRPEPIVVHCTFDWTNSVQKAMGTAHESYECIWLGDVWKLRTVA